LLNFVSKENIFNIIIYGMNMPYQKEDKRAGLEEKQVANRSAPLSHRRRWPVLISTGNIVWPLSLRLSLRWQEGEGTSFFRFVARACVLWCIVGVVGAAPGQINLPKLQSHISSDLYNGVSELLATCAY
jgi:hypothetical protein